MNYEPDMTKSYIQHVSTMAKLGDWNAAFYLGLVYLYGTNKVEPYPEEAKYWLSKAYANEPKLFKGQQLPDWTGFKS